MANEDWKAEFVDALIQPTINHIEISRALLIKEARIPSALFRYRASLFATGNVLEAFLAPGLS